jgi:hypothetical protein
MDCNVLSMDSPSCQFLDHDDLFGLDFDHVFHLGKSGMDEGCEI